MISRRIQTLRDVLFQPHADDRSVNVRPKLREHYLNIISDLSIGRSFECVMGNSLTAYDDVNEFLKLLPF